MRFHRFGKYEFRDTERKRAAFARKQKAEREAQQNASDEPCPEACQQMHEENRPGSSSGRLNVVRSRCWLEALAVPLPVLHAHRWPPEKAETT